MTSFSPVRDSRWVREIASATCLILARWRVGANTERRLQETQDGRRWLGMKEIEIFSIFTKICDRSVVDGWALS